MKFSDLNLYESTFDEEGDGPTDPRDPNYRRALIYQLEICQDRIQALLKDPNVLFLPNTRRDSFDVHHALEQDLGQEVITWRTPDYESQILIPKDHISLIKQLKKLTRRSWLIAIKLYEFGVEPD